jgi:hypothetical protein
MNHFNQNFRGQRQNEELICFFRHHWIYLTKEFAYLSLFLVIVLISLAKFTEIQEIISGSREWKIFFFTSYLTGTFYLHRFFIRMFNHFVQVGIVTDSRIIDHQKSIFFRDTMDSIDISKIQNIERVGDGFLPNMLGYGDIRIFLTASSSIKTFYAIPNIESHFRSMNEQKQELQNGGFNREHQQIQEHHYENTHSHTREPSSQDTHDSHASPPFQPKTSPYQLIGSQRHGSQAPFRK